MATNEEWWEYFNELQERIQKIQESNLPDDIKEEYQVWIARYGEYKPDVKLAIWQLSPDGHVNGIHGEVDINIFNGYRDRFDEFLERSCLR